MSYEQVREVAPGVAAVRQRNPGPMTLDGTNTWLLGTSRSVVVDPGEDAGDTGGEHLRALLDAAPNVDLIVLTHRHFDHSQLAPALHEASGAPVRAADPTLCIDGAPLADAEVISAGGVELRVLLTPGHTSDSTCLELDGGAVLTGDTILGQGTTVVAHPDGSLGPYLDSLARLRDLGDRLVLPGHGPELASLSAVASQYLAHRAERLDQIRSALERLGADASARAIVELVYADVDQSVWWAAELSVQAQLDYLRAT